MHVTLLDWLQKTDERILILTDSSHGQKQFA
jgi:hypothetical protein